MNMDNQRYEQFNEHFDDILNKHFDGDLDDFYILMNILMNIQMKISMKGISDLI